MGLLLRTLLIWLLVLAVPAQGAAAATMAFCGPNHHAVGTTTAAQPVAPAEHPHPGSDAESAHGHHAMAAQGDEGGSASAAAAAPTKFVQADQQGCSACASCCSVSAILSPLLTVPAPTVTATVFGAVSPDVDAVAVDAPDRPPRPVLA